MTWTVEVNSAACVSSGVCAGIAPHQFRVEGPAAVPVATEIAPDDDVLEAAEACPRAAISITAEGRDVLS